VTHSTRTPHRNTVHSKVQVGKDKSNDSLESCTQRSAPVSSCSRAHSSTEEGGGEVGCVRLDMTRGTGACTPKESVWGRVSFSTPHPPSHTHSPHYIHMGAACVNTARGMRRAPRHSPLPQHTTDTWVQRVLTRERNEASTTPGGWHGFLEMTPPLVSVLSYRWRGNSVDPKLNQTEKQRKELRQKWDCNYMYLTPEREYLDRSK
jgi:hypothetical protein